MSGENKVQTYTAHLANVLLPSLEQTRTELARIDMDIAE
jgi:hypothetical protein